MRTHDGKRRSPRARCKNRTSCYHTTWNWHWLSVYLIVCPKIANRSDFSLAKTVHASRVTKEIFPRTGEDLKRLPMPLMFADNRAVRSPREVKENQREINDIKMQALRDIQSLNEVQDTLKHVKHLRGKSAKAIEFQLRTEAMRNLTKSQELADIRKFQKETVHNLCEVNDRAYSRLLNEKAMDLIDEEKLIRPLDMLSKELRGYEQKSSDYFLDKRYRDRSRRDLLYGCRGCEYFNVKRNR